MARTLYTFGCSFTQYGWPTWADIAGQSFDKHVNYGFRGCGNEYILLALTELLHTTKIDPDDEIIIMWSSVTRLDIYRDGHWCLRGNVYNSDLTKTDVLKYESDDVGFYYKSIGYILTACRLLSATNVKWRIAFAFPLLFKEYTQEDLSPEIIRFASYYNTCIDQYAGHVVANPLFGHVSNYGREELAKAYVFNGKPSTDLHPTPAMHLRYLNAEFPDIIVSNAIKEAVKKDTNELLNIRTVDDINRLLDYSYVWNVPVTPPTKRI